MGAGEAVVDSIEAVDLIKAGVEDTKTPALFESTWYTEGICDFEEPLV